MILARPRKDEQSLRVVRLALIPSCHRTRENALGSLIRLIRRRRIHPGRVDSEEDVGAGHVEHRHS